MVPSMKPRHWGLRVAGGILGQVVLIVAILAVLVCAPRVDVRCTYPSGANHPSPVPAAGGVALGLWLLAAVLSGLLIRGFRRHRFIATPAGPSRNGPARVGLGCVISLLALATFCAILTASLAFFHPAFPLGCYQF